jgi:hypothetical protein
MHQGRTVFSQLMSFLPDRDFRRVVERYDGDSRLRGFSCWDQFLAMAFAQLTFRESLRDVEACLKAGPNLYHLGLRGKVSRSTLADANEAHDWRIFADFAQILIHIARPLYAEEPMGMEFDSTLYALDSTTIDLCLSLFPWAKFRSTKAAVKMHTLLDLRGNIPTFIRITNGKVHDVNILDELLIEAGAFYVMDRGYVDLERLYVFTVELAFFVTRYPSVTFGSSAAPRVRWIKAQDCARIRLWFRRRRCQPLHILPRCGASVMLIRRPESALYS